MLLASPRDRLVYAAAWLPYAAMYFLIFLHSRGGEPLRAGVDVAVNVGTAALLGLGALAAADRLHRRGLPPLAFFASHTALALAYTVAWWMAIGAALTVRTGLTGGGWSALYLRGYAFPWQMFSGVMVYGTIAAVGTAVEGARRAREVEARAARSETLRARAELQALRARLDPHFLFNTIHSVMALVRHDPPGAEAALERFAGMLRFVLHARRTEDDEVLLSEEWKFARDYLDLERIRLGERLRVEEQIDPRALACTLPALTLQPLVENSVRHAVAPYARGGRITLAARLRSGVLELSVQDDGPGRESAAVALSAGVGIDAVRQRLHARFGAAASLEIRTAPGEGFTTVVRLPARTSAESEEACESAS
jgi:signal transduction histidine kinase